MPELNSALHARSNLKAPKMDVVASSDLCKYALRTPETPLYACASRLTALAHQFVLQKLEEHGNGISLDHALALRQLLSGLTDQGLRINKGRFAYALPCGAGKTLSVISWIAAQHHLGLKLSIAVSAQQIEALCSIKAGLIKAGVSESLIGIRHTKGKGRHLSRYRRRRPSNHAWLTCPN